MERFNQCDDVIFKGMGTNNYIILRLFSENFNCGGLFFC
jgi:hypothetical protein